MGLELLGCDIGNGIGGVGGGLEREEVGEETANMWGGHGGPGDGVGGVLAADPSRLDVETRGEDVSALFPR